jgi:hypothetical protein
MGVTEHERTYVAGCYGTEAQFITGYAGLPTVAIAEQLVSPIEISGKERFQ